MTSRNLTDDHAAQFGTGLATVGLFGKTAVITKGIGVTAAIKGGVLVGGIISAPLAIGVGVLCIGLGAVNHYGKCNWW